MENRTDVTKPKSMRSKSAAWARVECGIGSFRLGELLAKLAISCDLAVWGTSGCLML